MSAAMIQIFFIILKDEDGHEEYEWGQGDGSDEEADLLQDNCTVMVRVTDTVDAEVWRQLKEFYAKLDLGSDFSDTIFDLGREAERQLNKTRA